MGRSGIFSVLLTSLALFGALPNLAAASECSSHFSNPQSIQTGVEATRERLEKSNFNTGRSLFYQDGANPLRTVYEDFFDRGFVGAFLGLKNGSRILDTGAGAGMAAYSYEQARLKNPGSLPQLIFDAATYALPAGEHVLFSHYNQVLVGNILDRSLPLLYDMAVDSNGGFSYVDQIDLLIEKVISSLKTGARYYTAYDDHMVMRDAKGEPLLENGEIEVRPNFQVVDAEGQDVTDLWLHSIQGLRVVPAQTEPLVALPGRSAPYRTFWDRLEATRASPLSPDVKILDVGLRRFVVTAQEHINNWRPLTLERTTGRVVAPKIQLIEYRDGRPPVRIYLWNIRPSER